METVGAVACRAYTGGLAPKVQGKPQWGCTRTAFGQSTMRGLVCGGATGEAEDVATGRDEVPRHAVDEWTAGKTRRDCGVIVIRPERRRGMNDNDGFARFAGISAVLALPFVILLGVVSWAAYGGDLSSLSNGSLVSGGLHRAELLRWSMIVDVFGYYLILLPLIALLWTRLERRDPPLARFAALSGFGYVLVGAIGAALLAVVDPLLMQRFTEHPAQRETVRLLYEVFTRGVAIGFWNVLEQLLLAAWLVGTGMLLRSERRSLSFVAFAAAAFALADAVGRMTDLTALGTAGAVGTVLLPVFVVWTGVQVLRQPSSWPGRTTDGVRDDGDVAPGPSAGRPAT